MAQLDDAKKKKMKKKKKVAFDLNVATYDLPAEVVLGDYAEGEEGIDGTAGEDETQKGGTLHSENSTVSAASTNFYPLNNRYQSCASSDEECEDTDTKEIGVEEEDDDDVSGQDNFVGQTDVIEQESSESLFSLSIDSRKHVCAAGAEEKEVNSHMPMKGSQEKECMSNDLNQSVKCRSQYVHSVLKPVENLSHWEKAFKARTTFPLQIREKENMEIEQEFAFSVLSSSKAAPNLLNRVSSKLASQEIAVDTSLSSWLNQSESTPKSKTSSQSAGNSPSRRCNTPKSAGDRLILGTLTVEDLWQLSSNSRRQSRVRSPDDVPIIGTVGSYWIRMGQVEDSDLAEEWKARKPAKR